MKRLNGTLKSCLCQAKQWTAEISAIVKDLKDVGMVVPTTSPITALSSQCRRQSTENKGWLSKTQVVTAIASIGLDVVFLLEQMNTSPALWHLAIGLTDAFFLVPIHDDHQKPTCFLLARPAVCLYSFTLRIFKLSILRCNLVQRALDHSSLPESVTSV